jgi:hypothetical protein
MAINPRLRIRIALQAWFVQSTAFEARYCGGFRPDENE